jgi:peptide deformylase
MPAIIQKSDPILRKVAKEVTAKQFGSEELLRIVSDMKKALASQEDGVAIAAPQIGISLRIFVVAPRVFDIQAELRDEKRGAAEKNMPEKTALKPLVYINPTLAKLPKKKRLVDEGCLSVRNYYGKVRRAEKATVYAFDELGRKFSWGGIDLLAQIYQHEIDHLDGTLFIDRTEDLYYLPPPENRKPKPPTHE